MSSSAGADVVQLFPRGASIEAIAVVDELERSELEALLAQVVDEPLGRARRDAMAAGVADLLLRPAPTCADITSYAWMLPAEHPEEVAVVLDLVTAAEAAALNDHVACSQQLNAVLARLRSNLP